MSNYEVMGNLKVLNDYSENGKPNWYAIINDADDKEHRAYVNQDLASLNREISDPNAIVECFQFTKRYSIQLNPWIFL